MLVCLHYKYAQKCSCPVGSDPKAQSLREYKINSCRGKGDSKPFLSYIS